MAIVACFVHETSESASTSVENLVCGSAFVFELSQSRISGAAGGDSERWCTTLNIGTFLR
jgi:hypothetical protein